MLEKFLNIFRIEDLRKRIFFTLGLLAVYRLGAHIPTPGIDAAKLAQFFNGQAGGALGLLDLYNGGNLRKLTVFALGIMPYITASIIFQLLTVIYEPLAKLQKEGELGRRKITQWTRYVTVLLAIVQSFAIALGLINASTPMTTIPRAAFIPMCVITLTTGTAFIMWLGERLIDDGEQLEDDRRSDVRHDAEREDGELAQVATVEEVKQAERAAGVLVEELSELAGVHAGRGNVRAEAIDGEQAECESDALAQIGNAEDVEEFLEHRCVAFDRSW